MKTKINFLEKFEADPDKNWVDFLKETNLPTLEFGESIKISKINPIFQNWNIDIYKKKEHMMGTYYWCSGHLDGKTVSFIAPTSLKGPYGGIRYSIFTIEILSTKECDYQWGKEETFPTYFAQWKAKHSKKDETVTVHCKVTRTGPEFIPGHATTHTEWCSEIIQDESKNFHKVLSSVVRAGQVKIARNKDRNYYHKFELK